MSLVDARKEVSRLSDKALERATAKKWAERAIACLENVKMDGKYVADNASEKWLLRAQDYHHEALEHAALVGDGGRTVAKIEKLMARSRRKVQKSS